MRGWRWDGPCGNVDMKIFLGEFSSCWHHVKCGGAFAKEHSIRMRGTLSWWQFGKHLCSIAITRCTSKEITKRAFGWLGVSYKWASNFFIVHQQHWHQHRRQWQQQRLQQSSITGTLAGSIDISASLPLSLSLFFSKIIKDHYINSSH